MNGNQRENVVTESYQRDDPLAAQSEAPQVNDDDNDDNYSGNVLSRNMDANDLAMLPIEIILILTQEHFMKYSNQIENDNPLPANFSIETIYDARVLNGQFATVILNNTINWHHLPHLKERLISYHIPKKEDPM